MRYELFAEAAVRAATRTVRPELLAAVMKVDLEEALTEAWTLGREQSPRDALAEWLVRLT